jgi:hypothetical protein
MPDLNDWAALGDAIDRDLRESNDAAFLRGAVYRLRERLASLTTERDQLRELLDESRRGEGRQFAEIVRLCEDVIAPLRAERDTAQAELERTKGARLLSVIFGHHAGAPRAFALQRKDRTLVALGAEFPDGAVALRLANDGGWTTYSEGGADALAFGGIEVLWLSDELESLAEMEQQRDAAQALLVEEQRDHAATREELAKADAKIARLRWLAIYRVGPDGGICRTCGGKENAHRMRCRHYVGPLEHRMSLRGINGSFGGYDYDCICGGWFRQGGLAGHGDGTTDAEAVCPNADQTWRGPAVDALGTPTPNEEGGSGD